MKKFSLLSSLLLCVCLFVSIDSLQADDEIQTETICYKDTFYFNDKSHEYETPLVNTVYRLELSKDLHRFRSYMIEYDNDFDEFLKSNGGNKLLGHTQKYNKLILDILDEKTAKELYQYSHINLYQMNFNYYKGLILDALDKFKSMEDEADAIKKIIEKCKKKFERVEKLFDILLNLKKGYMTTGLLSESKLKLRLEGEQFRLPDHLVSVFKEEALQIHYNKKITLLSSFRTNRKSKLFFSKESYVTLIYTIYLPLQNKSAPETDEDCTPASALPEFYRKH